MKVEVSKSFEKDVSKIKDEKLATRLGDIIDNLEQCKTPQRLPILKNWKQREIITASAPEITGLE